MNLEAYLSGVHVAFAGGTGAFCFLDFVAFVLRLMVYRIAKSKNFTNNINIYEKEEEDFAKVNKDFKLVYFSSFSDEESAVYLDICNKMQELDKAHNLNIFTFINRLSNKQKRWTKDFICEELNKNGTSNIKQVFICGPTLFIDDIQSNIKDVVVKEKIVLV